MPGCMPLRTSLLLLKPLRLVYLFSNPLLSSCLVTATPDYDIVASAPLAFTTPSPEFWAGMATGRPLAFEVMATISRSINSLVSRAKSSTSEGWSPFVSIGFKTTRISKSLSVVEKRHTFHGNIASLEFPPWNEQDVRVICNYHWHNWHTRLYRQMECALLER